MSLLRIHSLTSVTIPDSASSIGVFAFNRCAALANLTIPESVASIGEYAFYMHGTELILMVTGNSIAEQYAQKNDIPYILR